MSAYKKRNHRNVHVEAEEEGGWLVSYADLVTLLLCVFVLLFAMSSLDTEKIKAVTHAVSNYMNHKESPVDDETDANKTDRQLQALRLLTEYLELGHPDELLAKLLRMGERPKEIEDLKFLAQKLGIVTSAQPQSNYSRFELVISSQMLFEPGTARLTVSGYQSLLKIADKIANSVKQPGRRLEISGHTDTSPLPKDSLFSSQQMLSAARAEAVSLALAKVGVSPEKIQITGKGSTEPLLPERTADGKIDAAAQAKNRRIVISILTSTKR